MKVNPRFFAICLMAFVSINLTFAQTGKDKGKFRDSAERSAKQLEKMAAELALTETQVAQISAINTEYAAQMEAAKEAATDKESQRATSKALRAEKTAAVKNVLDSEQLAKFEAMKSEGKGKRGEGRKGNKGERGASGKNAGTPEERAQKQTEKLTEQLGLSGAQATEVAAINLDYAAKMNALKEASTERGANREALQTLKTEQQTAIKSVLTADQVAAYEAMKSEGKGKRGKKRNRR